MSRSYRKPYVTDHQSCKLGKVMANRWIRRTKTDLKMGQGSAYKKHFESWDIRDYKVIVKDPTIKIKYSRK